MTFYKKHSSSIYVFLLSIILLSPIQLKLQNDMILLERFVKNGGWIEIFFLSLFGALLVYKMQDSSKSAKWRSISWTLFTIVFFSQVILGLLGFEKFLMSGKLHLPVPGIIIGGAIFRMKISFMPILLFSTIIISGPAWCSQLCYFGALDNLSSKVSAKKHKPLKNILTIKRSLISVFIITVVLLRFFNTSIKTATIIGGVFGIVGLLIILGFSSRKGKMIHCIYYCPIGTIVNYSKYINPFRMYIDSNCTECMKCTSHCNYASLQKENISKRKPGITCTYCGDCISSCSTNSIKYKFLSMSPEKARKLWLIITVSLYIVFLASSRI